MRYNALTGIFNNIADLREYAPYVAGDMELSELNSSAINARKQIQDITTAPIWNSIIEDVDSVPFHYLKLAFGNLIMHKAIVFATIAKRMSGGADVYKYELETMRRQYIDNYFNAMDSLVRELDANESYSEKWHNTTDYQYLDRLRIKTTSEFNSLYGIDMSYLFFFRTIAIQREVLDDIIDGYFDRINGREAAFETKLKRALAMLVISVALRRFDTIELPMTIRNLFDDSKNTTEKTTLDSLSVSLQSKAMETLRAIELALSEPVSGNIDSTTSFNRPGDKIYLMS